MGANIIKFITTCCCCHLEPGLQAYCEEEKDDIFFRCQSHSLFSSGFYLIGKGDSFSDNKTYIWTMKIS